MSDLILIVEDEQDLNRTLDFNLRRDGFATKCATTGEQACSLAWEEPIPDLVLLDLMLPDMSGLEVCRKLRQNALTQSVPIIMLTAKGEEMDRVVGFEVGADDYVVKPFSVRELCLRIRAVLRRGHTQKDEGDEDAGEILEFGELQLNIPGHYVCIAGEEVTLTALEFRLLKTLLERKGRVQSRDTLLHDVWGIQADVATRTVDTHVKRLREKLGASGRYIRTMRGVGYRWDIAPNEPPSS